MYKLVAKCGIDCITCPWGPNSRKEMSDEEFELYRNNAKRILGYMPIKTPCLMCQTPDSKIPKGSKLPNRRCLIRQCVDKSGIANCAYCSRFPCETMKATSGLWNRDSVEKKLGAPISDKDYYRFVEPFEGIIRLEVIRSSLKPEEIVEPAKGSKSKPRIVDFPENPSISEEETESFKTVHKLLSSIKFSSFGQRDADTFAQHHRIENQKAHIMKFLWILGRYGKFEKNKSTYLVIDAKTYGDNRGSEKTLAIWSFVRNNIIKILSEFGICTNRVTLKGFKEEDLVTGTGYLKSKGWIMKISFDKNIWDSSALKALQTFTRRLEDKYDKKAFKHFTDVDMQILLERR